mmetsp:Transcript_32886/g.47509  ORF Transcript_32886/g.47509 Transcript_32886/m.47509 type:complete len:166 (-) Transcript_32886:253-750(-)
MIEETNIADGIPKTIEECPPPPRYYKLFTDESFVEPPPISLDSASIYGSIYNGVLPKIRNKNLQFDENKNYKQMIKTLLKNILDKSLLFMSSDDTRQFNAEQAASELRQLLTDIHICLEEYRYHEGREQLIKELAAEVQSINAVKDELERCVQRNLAVAERMQIT